MFMVLKKSMTLINVVIGFLLAGKDFPIHLFGLTFKISNTVSKRMSKEFENLNLPLVCNRKNL